MSKCEDWPCCGHEAGCCPSIDNDGNEINYCCECKNELPEGSSSSLCYSCQQAIIADMNDGVLEF